MQDSKRRSITSLVEDGLDTSTAALQEDPDDSISRLEDEVTVLREKAREALCHAWDEIDILNTLLSNNMNIVSELEKSLEESQSMCVSWKQKYLDSKRTILLLQQQKGTNFTTPDLIVSAKGRGLIDSGTSSNHEPPIEKKDGQNKGNLFIRLLMRFSIQHDLLQRNSIGKDPPTSRPTIDTNDTSICHSSHDEDNDNNTQEGEQPQQDSTTVEHQKKINQMLIQECKNKDARLENLESKLYSQSECISALEGAILEQARTIRKLEAETIALRGKHHIANDTADTRKGHSEEEIKIASI